jgi:hypothetical protein
MTDRAQPGAIDSTVRNDELAQALRTEAESFVQPADEPTAAAQRRANIDEAALNAFDLTSNRTSLDVTVDPGEAFVGGWVARDVPTTLTLPQSSTVEIVVGWNPDAIFDPNTDPNRDAADEAIVDLARDVTEPYPLLPVWRAKTDTSGVFERERLSPLGFDTSSLGETYAIHYLNP